MSYSKAEPNLWLASQSPRRRELLAQLGVSYGVLSVDVPEQRRLSEKPLAYVKRLAASKAQAGLSVHNSGVVLGADTVVVLGETVLGKPRNEDDAQRMLALLSGQTHQVVTAVTLCTHQQGQSHHEGIHCVTQVTFRAITADEVARYWRTGEPQDKAGGYGIQGFGAVFVERIEGSYSNVVGLPLFETSQLLTRFNIPIWTPYE